MSVFTEQPITIYNRYKDGNSYKWHKTYKMATFRNGSLEYLTNTTENTSYTSLCRIYDTSDYVEQQKYAGEGWTCQNKDIIVSKHIDDEITTSAPITELRNKYGNNNVFSIVSYDDYRKRTRLSHIKIGLN